jgi:imidazolonepropionase-like amidohydrolase
MIDPDLNRPRSSNALRPLASCISSLRKLAGAGSCLLAFVMLVGGAARAVAAPAPANAPAAAAETGTTTLEYSWLTADRITGSQIVSRNRDGVVTIQFEYADRGRGPSFRSTLKLGTDGLPVAFSATGVNNTRATIDEQFRVERGFAIWKSSLEQGRRRSSNGEFFLPFNDTPEVRAVLARALLRAPGRRLELLPAGTASIEQAGGADFQRDGQSLRTTLYNIEGLGLGPTFVWLDDAGELFGFTDRTWGVIRRGWEASMPALRAAERSARQRHYEQIGAAASREMTGLTVIRGAKVFDSIKGGLTEPATVFVWDGKISAVYPGEVPVPEGALLIDGRGKTLMPSLWDMHNHVQLVHLPEYLAFGITNVRDMGSSFDDLQFLLREIREQRLAGPDIHPLGVVDRANEFAAPVGMLADGLESALGFVDFYAQHGYSGLKIYSSIKPEWVAPLASAAHARGLPVAGHIPAFMSPEAAIRAGYDEITHMNQLLLAFVRGEELDTRGPARFLVPGELAGQLDLDSAQVRNFIALMKQRDIALEPTLAVIMEMFRNRPGAMTPIFTDVVTLLPESVRRRQLMTTGYNQGREAAFARSADMLLRLIALLHDSGIRILPGTDNQLPGFTLIRELIYYTEAGIPPAEVLQLATIGPARHMGLAHRLGSVEPGKDAQMYLIDGDPLADITALYRVEQVFKGRWLYSAPDLLRAQGFKPATATRTPNGG